MKMRKVLALGVVVVLLAGVASLAAQDEDMYKAALAYFGQYCGSKVAAERAMAVEKLGDATYPDADKKTAQLILGVLEQEVARGKGGKKEYEVSGTVLEACENAIGKITDEKAVRFLLKVAGSKKTHPRLRFHVITGMVSAQSEKLHDMLVEMVDDPDPIIQIAAMDALVKEGSPDSLQVFVKVLSEPRRTWEVKVAALDGIQKTAQKKDAAVIDGLIGLIDKLHSDEERVLEKLKDVLNELMGTDIQSDDPNAWISAWTAIKEGTEAPAAGKPGAPGAGHKTQVRARPVKFFGLETKSARIVFILDRTGSMSAPLDPADPEEKREEGEEEEEREDMATGRKAGKKKKRSPAKAPAKELKKKYDNRTVKTRMDGLKKEFINTVYYMDEAVHFTVIWYNTSTQIWRKLLVPATWENKLDIIRETDKLVPTGGTNIWGALEDGFRIIGNPKNPRAGQAQKVPTGKGNYAVGTSGPDTFFLMTDGAHNSGPFVNNPAAQLPSVDRNAFLAELRKVNRVRKIVVHTLCLGSRAFQSPSNPAIQEFPDTQLMQSIASETGGKFRHIRDR
ncbi:MAG: HEAT repeat domain-containing protein [Planctomycetota bacterium]|jgi:hypothetical protein